MDYLTFVLGVIFGVIITNILIQLRSKHGTLLIDQSNPEKDKYRFEINDLSSLAKKKHIVLRIDNKADLSHE